MGFCPGGELFSGPCVGAPHEPDPLEDIFINEILLMLSLKKVPDPSMPPSWLELAPSHAPLPSQWCS